MCLVFAIQMGLTWPQNAVTWAGYLPPHAIATKMPVSLGFDGHIYL
jgi:hypothetical protein